MARPDFLSQLPSLEELLENPRVSAAIERVNSSAAATQVRGAVTRLGSEIARRTDELKGLGASELLDRLLRQIDQPAGLKANQVINATGQFFGAADRYPPLAASAIDAAHAASSGFRGTGGGHAAAAAAKLLHCEHAAVFASPTSALAVALEALAAGGTCLVARGEMAELAPGVRLDDVVRRCGVTLREVGATDAATITDYDNALDRLRKEGIDRLVVLRRLGASDSTVPTLEELSTVASKHGATLVADVGRTRPTELTPAYGSELVTAEGALSAGAAVVLLNAAGRLGGPLAGILAGQSTPIDAIANSPAARADGVEPFVDAALAATLALFEQPEQLRFTHPLYQLLDAPLDNLRLRAEGIATQLAAVETIKSAVASEEASSDRPAWMIHVEPTNGTASELLDALSNRDPSIEATVERSAVILNLATVFASQDRDLLQAFLPKCEAIGSSAGD